MKRKDKILRHININGQGIEIGPSFNPVTPKKEGYKVHTIDHMNREQLIEKYKDNPNVNLDNIEEVDFIWQGESYAQLTGKTNYYDWIIASHVVEHTPDFIGFLNDCDRIMTNNAVISLVVPDKRYCFDRFRPITNLSKIIDSHLNNNKTPTPGIIAEYYLNVVAKGKRIAWTANQKGNYSFVHSLKMALDKMNSAIEKNTYIDVHSWCFTPQWFRLLIHDLFCLGFIPFKEVGFFPTQGCEFFITLGRHGRGITESRLDMLKKMEAETLKEFS